MKFSVNKCSVAYGKISKDKPLADCFRLAMRPLGCETQSCRNFCLGNSTNGSSKPGSRKGWEGRDRHRGINLLCAASRVCSSHLPSRKGLWGKGERLRAANRIPLWSGTASVKAQLCGPRLRSGREMSDRDVRKVFKSSRGRMPRGC